MVEKTILNYLNAQLPDGVKAYMEHPEGADAGKMVIVEKTSSTESDLVVSSMIAIQSYAPSLYEAASLNETVKGIMRNAISLQAISSCHLNTDYNYTDTTTKRYRYQAVYDVVTHL